MTARDLIACVLRRWYVLLVGAAVTVAALYFFVAREAPVYWTQYNLLLVAPTGPDRSSVLEHPLYGLQPLTGVVATDVNDGHPPLLTGDNAATMIGEGRRTGVQVRVPNLGTQWRPLFSANYLDVQVAGASPQEVAAEAARTNREVSAVLETRQDELGVPDSLRARAVPSSPNPTVYPFRGSRSRAAAAAALSGASITVVLIYWLERWRPRRRRVTTPSRTHWVEAS